MFSFEFKESSLFDTNSNSNSLLIWNPTKDCHQQQYNQQTNTKHETIKKTKSSVEEIPVYQHKVQYSRCTHFF